ncbi:MAG: DUF86 domain-containing protein [Chloroflexi bacterium]|nr:DUF86 domain-containing protein [Chloroflexota bacterium]
MRSDRERLLDIPEAIERIERYAARAADALADDELVQTWIIHHLEIIGEAARGLTADFRLGHAHVPWAAIIGMRNVLVHGYFGIDLAAVRAAVEHDLPQLKVDVRALLESSR